MAESSAFRADLVLEGGGATGIALTGALAVLEEAGFSFERVAGTSSGALVGAFVAAGIPAEEIFDVMRREPFVTFQDEGLVDRLGRLGKLASVVCEKGIYEGDRLEAFLREHLPEAAQTFGGLRLAADPEGDLPDDRRYRLLVMASDISRHQLARLPWDYRPSYGLDPDEQSVVAAVRASMSMPFFFEPAHLTYRQTDEHGVSHKTRSTLVDGGLLSDFAVDVFDRRDGREPRWPTIGVKLSGRAGQIPPPTPTGGPLRQCLGMVETLVAWRDRAHIHDPAATERTIFVDTSKVAAFDFGLLRRDQDYLYESGREAALKFLKTWDFEEHKARRSLAD